VTYPRSMDQRTLVGTILMFAGGLLFGFPVGWLGARALPTSVTGFAWPQDVSSSALDDAGGPVEEEGKGDEVP
jgi:hypothetical protein